MPARRQIAFEKDIAGAIQRADRTKVHSRQALKADNKMCDVARRLGHVVIVPINDHRASFGEDGLQFAEVAVAGAQGDSAGRWRGSPQPFEQMLTPASKRPVRAGYEAAFASGVAEVFLRVCDATRGRSYGMKSCQPSRATFGRQPALAFVAKFENLLGRHPFYPFLE